MLSVGSRNGGRKGIGFGLGFGGGGGRRGGGGMEESELEEGEACSGQDDDPCIDPDITLSYIDEKLQDVLGHFQKDFEGGVSAENLGAKFGGYGSFLPAYQRSPSTWPQPRSPPSVPNHNSIRSPCNSSFEGASIAKINNASASQSLDSSGDIRIPKLNAGESVPQHHNKPVNGSDQKTLKVRIKVGPDNSLTRNNAAIYSGLGLDISPSSSLESSLDGSGGLSPALYDAPDESPMTILQVMTCFTVPGGYLLSPLPDDLLQFQKRENAYLKRCRTGTLRKGSPETCPVVADLALSMSDVNGVVMEMKTRADEKIERFMIVKALDNKDDMGTVLKREINNEIPQGQKAVSDTLNVSPLSGSRSVDGKTKQQDNSQDPSSRVLDFSKEPYRILGKDKMSSPELVQDNQLESAESIKDNGFTNLGDKTTDSRELNYKTGIDGEWLEERNTGNDKEVSSDIQGEGISNVVKSDSVGYKGRNNHIVGLAEPLKQMYAQKATSYEEDGERILQGSDQLSDAKRELKENQSNGTPAVVITKENMGAVSSVALKEKISHSRGDRSENRSKTLKSRKETGKGHSKESHRDVMGGVYAKHVENRTVLLEIHSTDKTKDLKLDHEKGSSTFIEKSTDKPGCKKLDNLPISEAFVDAPVNTSLMCNALSSDAAAASHDTVLLKDNWVACDICQEWRLLPYGIDPAHLPKKWQCSMQTWLPELNRCHISEAVTTKALNALYQVPAPESNAYLNGHHEVVASTITSADGQHLDKRLEHDMQRMPTGGKKKHGLKDESIIQTSAKSRSLHDVTEYPAETNLLNKFIKHTSKSSDYTTEKHNHKKKDKHKIQGRYSDGGDFIEKNGKCSKLKSEGDVDLDEFRSSKKLKREGLHYPVENRHSNLDVAGGSAVSMDNDFSTKGTLKSMQKYRDYTSHTDLKCDPKGHLPASMKRSNDQVNTFSNGEFKGHISASNVEKSGTWVFSAKRRKMKEWQASQGHKESLTSSKHALDDRAFVKEAFSESEPRKQKKAKVSKSVAKEFATSKADGRMDKACSTIVLLSDSREQPPDRTPNGRGVSGKEQERQDQGTAISQRALDCTDYLKRDMTYAQPPPAATSSSSKVSGSRKSKAKYQEGRGSPVESVSSSPLRTSNAELLSARRNSVGKDVINVGFSSMGRPRKCLDDEVDGGDDQSGTRKKKTASSVQQKSLESHKAAEFGLDSLRGTHDFLDREENRLLGGKAEDGTDLKSGSRDDLSPLKFEDMNVVNGTDSISGKHIKYNYKGSDEDRIHDQDKMNDHRRANGPSQRKSGKSSSLHFKGRDKCSKSDVDKGRLNVSDFFREQKEAYTAKNGSSWAGIDSHDHSTCSEDFRDGSYDVQERRNGNDDMGKKDPSLKWSVESRKDGYSDYGRRENLDGDGPPVLPKKHKDFDSRDAGATCSKLSSQQNLQHVPSKQDGKSSSHSLSNRIGRSDMDSGRGKSLLVPPKDKQETLNCDPQVVPTFVNGRRSEVHPTDAVNDDASTMVKQSSKADSQNGLRQGTPNCPDASCPIRKDGPTAATLMEKDRNLMEKEARNLKHTANRLKLEGLQLESIGLFFEAALKYLQVASLLEPTSFESAEHGEAIKSVQMYSETARLCQYCAREYEKCNEMAAAALAYKCVEVAYMKVAYYNHPSGSKDRHELHAALQMVQPGESPSSSASDVDNLNNHGTLDKAKGAASPQIAGSHVIAARNRPSCKKTLDDSNDINCAFEATWKSQIALAAANANLGNGGVDGMSSVKEVLDFNFHNIQGLLRLVRLSMESISH